MASFGYNAKVKVVVAKAHQYYGTNIFTEESLKRVAEAMGPKYTYNDKTKELIYEDDVDISIQKQVDNKDKKNICIDLDGVLAKYEDWHGIDYIDEPIEGAQGFVKSLREKYRIVIYTVRCNADVNKLPKHILWQKVKDWLDKYGFEYDEIYTGQGKPVAVAYIDDKAIQCRPQENKRAYDETLRMLKLKDIDFSVHQYIFGLNDTFNTK